MGQVDWNKMLVILSHKASHTFSTDFVINGIPHRVSL